MIGRRAIDRAAAEAIKQGGAEWIHGLAALDFDLQAVEEYAERAVAVFERRGLEPEEAVRAGFRLGLQIGYRIADARRRVGS